MKNFNPVILLTATINPNGTSNTKLLNIDARKNQYLEAIKFYIEYTHLKIIICENTGFDFTPFFDNNNKNELECLCFRGNDYDKSRGKGYGEALIIKYAIENSKFIREADTIIKITGRVKILNINEIINLIRYQKRESIGIEFWGKNWIQSICFVSHKDWLYNMIKDKLNHLDDRLFNFQKMMYQHLYSTINPDIFSIYPIVYGISGKTNLPYSNNTLIQRKIDNYYGLKEMFKNKSMRLSYFLICNKFFCMLIYKKILDIYNRLK